MSSMCTSSSSSSSRAGWSSRSARTGRAVIAVAAIAKSPQHGAMPSRKRVNRSDSAMTLPQAAPANGASAAASPAALTGASTDSVIRPAPAAAVLFRAPPAAAAVAAAQEPLAAAAATSASTAADRTLASFAPGFDFDEDTSGDGWHRDGSFRIAMSPRPHEIDEFGVVNNTYYNTYMYAARYRYMTELGVAINAWQSRGVNSITVKVCTAFRKPLRLSDPFYASSAVKSVPRSQLVLSEAVRRRSDDALVAFSEVTCATVDDDFKVCRIPEEVRLTLERGAARFAAASDKSSS